MPVKVFESPDMASGLKLVKKELGPDALILSTRTIKSGKLGILGKHVLEITAAVDTPWPKQQDKAPNEQPHVMPPPEHQAYVNNASLPSSTPMAADHAPSSVDALYKIGKKPEKLHLTPKQEPPMPDNPRIRQEFDELKSIVKSLADEISRLGRRQGSDNSLLAGLHGDTVADPQSADRTQVLDLLLSYGTNRETAQTISGFAKDNLSNEEIRDRQKLCSFLQNAISNILEVQAPDFTGFDRQQRMALVGPTGVGKTTTLAKIAAGYLSSYSNSIALITIDTYRIAAVEQLKVYGEIMHLPVDVVLTPAQLSQAIEKHQDKNLILIDTAGRSPRDTLSIDELASFLQPDLAITKHLVLSATNREDELAETIARFSRLGIDNTIYTKVDECINLGVILNTQIHNSAPISYITNGQRVPEDLFAADKKKIAELIIPNPEGIFHD
jgi:flagellar biosynthesis protein FlhF